MTTINAIDTSTTSIGEFVARCRDELANGIAGGDARRLSPENYEQLELLVRTLWGDEANVLPDEISGVLDSLAEYGTSTMSSPQSPTDEAARGQFAHEEIPIVPGEPLPSADRNCVNNLRGSLGARIAHVDDRDLALAWREFGRSGHDPSDEDEFVENWLPEAPPIPSASQPATTTKPAAKPAAKSTSRPAKKSTISKPAPKPTVRKSTPARTTREEVERHLRAIGDENAEPVDMLRAGLCLVALDPIVYAARSREMVNDLIGQAASGIALVTGMASRLGVRFHDESIELSTDRALWPSSRLEQLSANVRVFVEHEVTRSQETAEQARRDVQVAAQLRDELRQRNDRITQLQEQVAALGNTLKQRTLEANTALAGQLDQDEFVVAQLDATTGRPLRYAVVQDDEHQRRIVSTARLDRATRFDRWELANDVRLRLARTRRDAARGGVIGSDQPSISVLRTSLRAVTAEDVVD